MLLTQHLNLESDIIPSAFYDEILHFSRIIVPVSGGVDSTIIALEFLRNNLNFELFWNDTRRSLKSARLTLSKIFRLSQKHFFITYPSHEQNFITEKTKEAMGRIVRGELKFNKKAIPCCYYLKEYPFLKWLRNNTDLDTVIISGIAGYEGYQRQIRLGELRNQNTFLRFKKKEQRWFAYPFRDYTSRLHGKRLRGFLQGKLFFSDTKRSGCFSCPIVALFEDAIEEDHVRIERSKKVYLATNDALET